MKIRYSWDDDEKKRAGKSPSLKNVLDSIRHLPLKLGNFDGESHVRGIVSPVKSLVSKIKIPSMHQGLPVSSISAEAFYSSRIKSVSIPDSVNALHNLAFGFCADLSSVVIPDSVTLIGEQAFQGCTSLTEITVGRGCTEIGRSAFYDCQGLKKVNISELSSWCDIKFENEESNPLIHAHELYLNGEPITELVIPEGTEEIGDYAFIGCKEINRVILPESIVRIGKEAFAECSSLTEISLYNGIESIGENAFSGCESLVSIAFQDTEEQWDYTVVAAGNEFLDAARLDCVNTKEISAKLLTLELTEEGDGYCVTGSVDSEESETETLVIPRRYEGLPVLQVGPGAFARSPIASVRLPQGLREIGDEAFAGCENLREIHIPRSVTYVSDSAFAFCKNLKNISVAPKNETYAFNGNSLISKGKLVRYGATGSDQIRVPQGVNEIGKYALPHALGLYIPTSVKIISCDLSSYYVTYEGTKQDWDKISTESIPKWLYTKKKSPKGSH